MRAVGYGESSAIDDINTVFACCNCGLCTYYACSMGLSPGTMVTMIKNGLLKKGLKPKKEVPFGVSKLRELKKVPVGRFIERLGLGRYDVDAPLKTGEIEVLAVRIPLKQHVGVPASAVVKEGSYVNKGDLIGSIEDGKVSANVHASITGVVICVTVEYIEISKRR